MEKVSAFRSDPVIYSFSLSVFWHGNLAWNGTEGPTFRSSWFNRKLIGIARYITRERVKMQPVWALGQQQQAVSRDQ